VTLPTTLITESGKDANKATPVMIHSRGAKVAFLQEPNKNQPIQSGPVKELTGHDKMYVRELFQKGSKIVEMEITVVPILITNKIPNIPDCQQAIWERTNVMEFSSRWDRTAPDDSQEQMLRGLFKMNKAFDRELPRMAPAFLWVMAQYYEKYLENFDAPAEVQQATDSFRISNNKFLHFTRDCVQQVVGLDGQVDGTAFVHLDDMYNAYRRWYNDQQYREKIDNKSQFKELLEMVWKQKAPNNVWAGLRLTATALQAAPAAGGQTSLFL
jgi:phage/plasmid-associated DNA primase